MSKRIVIPAVELWDPVNECFVYTKKQEIVIEHSLVSISKWEKKWHKPFLGKEKKTDEEVLDYIRCMTLTQNVNPEAYKYLTVKNINDINDYINDPMTATWFSKENDRPSNKIVTSELIYCWMISLNIPVEFQKWHLNRLLTLIRVCNEENKPKKNMNRRDVYRRNNAVNAARRKKARSRG